VVEKKIVKVYNDAFKEFGVDDRRSILWTKDKQDMRFELLLGESFKRSNMSLLDYGCGFGDLNLFLKKHYYDLKYSGCDINKNFINNAKKINPENELFLIESSKDIKNNYDIILISGTFNVLCLDSHLSMKEYVFEQLLYLFTKTNYMLSVNFLSHLTDKEYRYDGHFYLNPTDLYDFAVKNITKRVFMDASSLPYEITFKFFKNEKVDRDMTIYKR